MRTTSLLKPVNELAAVCVLSILITSCTHKSLFDPFDTDPGLKPIISDDVLHYTFNVIHEFPHDSQAFTQGLVFEHGNLFEGTGLYGNSSLRLVKLESGAIIKSLNLDNTFFGEGITVFKDKIYQLTWRSKTGFVYDKQDFTKLSEFSYPTEGWGLTHDGNNLILSDGSSNLYFLQSETFERVKEISVTYDGKPVTRLNELEYIQGRVFANIWLTDDIAVINPQTGEVTNWLDLNGLLKPGDYTGAVDVLNGIAFDAEKSRLFVTGKLWPKLFEIELIPGN